MLDRIRPLVRRDRLLDTATRLIAVPSPTGDAGAGLDTLARVLKADGFVVAREAAGHPKAPAVVVRLDSGRPGKCLQFDGHLDVVHLPFVPPRVEGNLLRGSGSCDMKGGDVRRRRGAAGPARRRAHRCGQHPVRRPRPARGPVGLGQQIDRPIRAGLHGDAVLIPEPLNQTLPVIGRGAATWKVTLSRAGPPVHEVMRQADTPNVIAAGADLVRGVLCWTPASPPGSIRRPASRARSSARFTPAKSTTSPRRSVCWKARAAGCPAPTPRRSKREFRGLLGDVARDHRVTADLDWRFIRGAFRLDEADPFVTAFQQSYAAVSGSPLPTGPKLFVDDGNSFSSLAGVPAITHGPRAGGQHTVEEWADIDDLVRVAVLYALTAVTYLNR